MIFHIAICSPDGALRSRLEHQCMEFFARREDACIVEQLQSRKRFCSRMPPGCGTSCTSLSLRR